MVNKYQVIPNKNKLKALTSKYSGEWWNRRRITPASVLKNKLARGLYWVPSSHDHGIYDSNVAISYDTVVLPGIGSGLGGWVTHSLKEITIKVIVEIVATPNRPVSTNFIQLPLIILFLSLPINPLTKINNEPRAPPITPITSGPMILLRGTETFCSWPNLTVPAEFTISESHP